VSSFHTADTDNTRQDSLVCSVKSVADWPAGKPGDFPVGPCYKKFFGSPAGRTRKFMLLIISWHSRQTGEGDVSYSFTCRLPHTRIKSLSDKNKKNSVVVFTTIADILAMEVMLSLYATGLESSFPFLTMRKC